MSEFLTAAVAWAHSLAFWSLAGIVVAAAAGQHPDGKAKKCPDRCACQETGRCGCVQCPTEMSAGLTRRAVMEGRRLVCFVAVKPRPVPGCIVYNSVRNEPGRPPRYVAVFAPDGTGGGLRYDLPADATDEMIGVTGDPRPLPAPPGMPRTR